MQDFREYSKYLQQAIESVDAQQIENFISILYKAYQDEKTVFVIGNGGSAANASHLAQDLAKGTRVGIEFPKRIKALSLTDNTSFISALGNDDGYDRIFEQQLRTYAQTGDYLIAISGSGNSPNIIKAVNWANENGLTTIGVTGFNGGKLKQINHHSVHVELNDMGTSESVHTVIFHYVIRELMEKMNAAANVEAIAE